MMHTREIRHFHLFCGLGAGARGFNRAQVRVGNLQGVFRCIGGIDVDPVAIQNFDRLTGTPGTVLDLFDREQYLAFHGREPGQDWAEASPADIRRAAGNERPHIVFLSAPFVWMMNHPEMALGMVPRWIELKADQQVFADHAECSAKNHGVNP